MQKQTVSVMTLAVVRVGCCILVVIVVVVVVVFEVTFVNEFTNQKVAEVLR